MKMDDLMRDTVAPLHPDTDTLIRTARAQGTAQRRRRRLATGAAALGVVAAVGLGATALVPVTGDGPGAGVDAAGRGAEAPPSATDQDELGLIITDSGGGREEPDTPVEGRGRDGTVDLDGRSTVALLRSLVGEWAEGATSEYGGQGADGGAPDTFGQLSLTPPGEGLGVVQVNVQGRDMLRDLGRGCAAYMADCTVTTMPGGDLLTVYSDVPADPEGVGQRRVVELQSQRRGIRVVASATNGLDLPSSRWEQTRPDPVLDDQQLTAIVTSRLWAFRVPAEYAEQGAALTPYTDFDADPWEREPSAGPSQG